MRQAKSVARAISIFLLLAGCPAEEQKTAEKTETKPAIEKVTEVGPVKATISLAPEKPRLGDPLILTLSVEAEPKVTVELPAFGEALGRFSIMDFTPRSETTPEGKTTATQCYRLQAPMSGKQRIPPLRIEFVDTREDEEAEAKELLTEALTLEVESVLPEGTNLELRPAKGTLPETIGTDALLRWWPAFAGGLVLLSLLVILPLVRRRMAERRRITAYDVAIRRLEALEQEGLPSAEAADDWYVELSSIIRRYLEGRFALRAPELTTEEFLQEAKESVELEDPQRELLSSFLEGCDRVKFAGYRPEEDESKEALTSARRFLQETRLVQEEVS